ncbi:DUF2225 domain-containing protein [Halalkalibacter nanhaiisediminis]|uniref:DUF2225 domain-containing protein n=1 Tax=Halalkalibacter nanhaiisediminis TaxID=688079 RepID=A0A562QHM7_9BACI|nr:DUF2225 domain-containing protein [Halalkalibacter nanhaiisediminis]TWI56173.1 hypothetical protein IQ10_02064 [Halalkalibacter nanhaiisediminis]
MIYELQPLYDKEVCCLFCEMPFQTKRMRSRFVRVNKIHSDFYTEYKDASLNPVFYEVDVCPHCGFASTEMFNKYFPPGTKAIILEQFQKWKTQDFGRERSVEDAIRTMKLGVLSAMLKKEKNIVIAGLCLRLAWMFRLLKDTEQERRFLEKALLQYEASYQQSDYLKTQMTDMRVLYLIGELSRRLEDEDNAIRYFSRVIQHENKSVERKLVEMAREQWHLIRDKEKVAAVN